MNKICKALRDFCTDHIAGMIYLLFILLIAFIVIDVVKIGSQDRYMTKERMFDALREAGFSEAMIHAIDEEISVMGSAEITVSKVADDFSLWQLECDVDGPNNTTSHVEASFQYRTLDHAWVVYSWSWPDLCSCGCDGECMVSQ